MGHPRPSPARERRFFLARTPSDGGPELLPEERDHVLRVLRLGAGDEIVGLDGRGNAWPLRITSARRASVELETRGPARSEPEPGSAGAALPWIELVVALPRPPRSEDMLERLCQLGIAALSPLKCERSHPRAQALDVGRRARLERIARSACKQADRLWLPELHEPRTPADWCAQSSAASAVRLDPCANAPLHELVAASGGAAASRERPLALVIGPEGGFADAEAALLDAAGARAAWLGPHVLRVATAAEAAAAVVALYTAAARRSLA